MPLPTPHSNLALSARKLEDGKGKKPNPAPLKRGSEGRGQVQLQAAGPPAVPGSGCAPGPWPPARHGTARLGSAQHRRDCTPPGLSRQGTAPGVHRARLGSARPCPAPPAQLGPGAASGETPGTGHRDWGRLPTSSQLRAQWAHGAQAPHWLHPFVSDASPPRSGGRAEGEHPLHEQHSSVQGSAAVLQTLLGLPGGALSAGSIQ